ncbi:nuclear transport factor 2 family protein [Flavobacterium kingsejongi]|uniref:SnoaL-like domain-containing protein n=1 Tax=Flavobacterium kingsejongi TaxID=1678728 RepID=A0A2S1LUD1_9FLAO|nr:nuclear transport factor 2 family protein [Flavobacterium kingsejongi]AWG27261.1 hypothetical protein FK004_05225 [Flavobacterium kingsejongi]
MKNITYLLLFLGFSTLHAQNTKDKEAITTVLNAWHKAAADAKMEDYFGYMAPDAIYIGTDATENWTFAEFRAFAKPYFDRGKAWNFTALQRNIYLSKDQKMAWFDELLDTQMKICRGSGVLQKINGQWKIVQYVLSMTVPNENSDAVVKIKEGLENKLIDQLRK